MNNNLGLVGQPNAPACPWPSWPMAILAITPRV
uniref:Uncharacterized protein n=1 Tax=Arundo donax TaxID=35708 RepID=A0A0A8Y8J3_ARUDO